MCAFTGRFLAGSIRAVDDRVPVVRRIAIWTLLGTWAPSVALAEPEVRILLQEDVQHLSLSAAGPHLWVGDSQVSWTERKRLEVEPHGEGVVVRVGSRTYRGERAVIASQDPIAVGSGRYLGSIEVIPQNGRLIAVNRIRIETYLLGIVGSEMSPSWPEEALKAQAVAARTYALERRLRMRSVDKPFDLRDSVLSQVYKGADRIQDSVVQAVRTTRGQVLAWRHEPAEALFHSTCGGATVAASDAFGNDVVYLQPRPCRWCRDSTRFRWKLELPARELAQLLRSAGLARGRVVSLERKDGDDGVRIRDGDGPRQLDPDRFRAAVGYSRLYSSRFSARLERGQVRVDGAGFGHGVGMCQWGARGMALEGKSYLDILAHYYDGAGIRRAY